MSPPTRSAPCLSRKPDAVLGLATGSSPLAIYDELAARCDAGLISFGQARGFTLDEYVGLPADHPQRYRNVIDDVFVSRVDFAAGAVQGPDGLAADIPAACAAYEDAIRAAGGVDLQILGIGTDGHIAFNEPGSSLASRTRIKTLTRQTQGRQRPVLRRRRRRGAHALPDPGAGDHHGGPARDPGGDRSPQGRSRAPSGRGRGQRAVAGDHPAASPARDGAARRCGGPTASARRLLPRDLPLQAGWQGI